MVREQEGIAQAVEGTHPNAPRIDGQQAGEAGKHLARRFIGKCDGKKRKWTGPAGLDQPSHAGGQDPRFTATRAGQYQRVLRRRCNRSEEHTSELQSLMRISYAVFCLKKKKTTRIVYKK